MDKFFIRFIMQRSIGSFEDNGFRYDYFMDGTKEEIETFIKECENWQKEQAEILAGKYDLKALHGKRILYVGDSITADRLGYRGITTYAAGLDAYNAAISGSQSTDMLRYLYDHIQSSKPDIISIMIGTNDAPVVANGKSVVSPEEYRKNISEILRISKESGAVVLISTLPPTNEKLFAATHNTYSSNMTNESINRLSEIIRDAQAKAVNEGKHWDGYKVVEGRSVRKYANESKIAQICQANGYKLPEIYKQTLIGITDMEKLMTKKRFRELLSDYIVKPKGKLTLVPVSDKREEVITLSEFKEES